MSAQHMAENKLTTNNRKTEHGTSEIKRRKLLLNQLIELFEGHDADDELRRLKAQDEGF